jgi:hypothetical protein
MAKKISQYYTYKIDGKEYKIRFETPNVRQQIEIGNSLAALRLGFQVTDELSNTLAYAVATLNIVIKDKPADLKLEEIDVEDWPELRKMLDDYQKFTFFRAETPAQSSSA